MSKHSLFRPATIVQVLQEGYRYVVTYAGTRYEAFSQPGSASLEVGDLLPGLRNVQGARQLFQPTSMGAFTVVCVRMVGGPRVVYTFDIASSSPPWRLATNPPALGANMTVNAFALEVAQPNTGYICYGGTNLTIYRISPLTSANSWTLVLDTAQFLGLTGLSSASDFSVSQPHSAKGESGFIVLTIGSLTNSDGIPGVWLLHSHTSGSDWTVVKVGGNAGSGTRMTNAVIAAANHNVILVEIGASPGSQEQVWRSDDKGHSINRVDDGSCSGASMSYLASVKNNADIAYAWYPFEIWKSTTRGVTWSAVSAINLQTIHLVGVGDQKIVLIDDSYRFGLSTDGAQNFTFVSASQSTALDALTVVQDGFYLVLQGGMAGINYGKVISFNDNLVETNRTGNLISILTENFMDGVAIQSAGVAFY